MAAQKQIRIGIIGVGIMGTAHAHDVTTLPNTTLIGICDIDPKRTEAIGKLYDVPTYSDYNDLLAMPDLDAIIIATPHYSHPIISMAAFEKGIHVLVEKPIAVHVNDCNKMITAYGQALKNDPNLKFAAMFMQRTYGYWTKIKDLIDSGEIGKLIRTTWIITDWFRTQTYYDMGGWRATWEGEGGGVLLNQSPHNLDLYQWLVGMPDRVRGFATFGKYHNIEVEDEVTAYFEYDSGMIGHFITSTSESPGTNRLEIVGENGKLIYEDGKLTFYRNRYSSQKQIEESTGGFEKVENWEITIPTKHHGQPGHRYIIENFANAILNDIPLIAPAPEGIHSVMLANAIILSSQQNKTVELPINGDVFEALLNQLIAEAKTS